MSSRYAVVVIAADGATDILGPYGSEARATHDAGRIRDEARSVAADVYLLDPPRFAPDYYPVRAES